MLKEKEHKLVLKLNSNPCIKCNKFFKNKDQIIILKDSRIIHKKCFEELKRIFEPEDV
jgi:hypothetical protein